MNNELVAILGNFVNRVVVLTHKYYQGIVPEGSNIVDIEHIKLKIEESLEAFNNRQALEHFMELARTGNKFLQESEPWKKIKDPDQAQLVADTLHTCIQIVKAIADYAQIFLPITSTKLYNVLNISALSDTIEVGHEINKGELLFEKIEDETIEKQIQKLIKAQTTETVRDKIETMPEKEQIVYDDFAKLDMRVATIVAAEKVKKADRLLKIDLDLGYKKATVVSGIAEHYSPEEIIGQQVTYLVNLAPRKLRGIESAGMILMAEDSDGKLAFVCPPSKLNNGSSIS